MKIRNRAAQGSFTHIFSTNAKCELQLFNAGNEANIKAELLDENDNLLAILASGDIEANASLRVPFFAQNSQKIKLTASDDIHSVLNMLCELTLATGALSQSTKRYTGDGATKVFAIGENAPAKNSTEVCVTADGFYKLKYGDEWEFSDDMHSVVLKSAPYDGADIVVKCKKWE